MRKELEQIIFLGKLTRTVEIFDKSWTIETLDFQNQVDLLTKTNAGKQDKFDFMSYKRLVVEKCLKTVEDIDIKPEEKKEFVSRLPMAVIDKLVKAYSELDEEFNKSINPQEEEEIKNSERTD